jgi:hypothetical protein
MDEPLTDVCENTVQVLVSLFGDLQLQECGRQADPDSVRPITKLDALSRRT